MTQLPTLTPKSVILLAFAGWSIFSTWYYLCKIKRICDRRAEVGNLTAYAPAIEENAVQPIDDESISVSAPTQQEMVLPAPQPVESADISRVSVVRANASDGVEIHFPYNSTQKEEDAAIDEYLSTLAQQLIQTGAKVVIAGHTDGIGDAQSNLAISDRRAKSIRDILILKGVPARQIQTKAFGESRPKASNDQPEGRYENRRVEINLID